LDAYAPLWMWSYTQRDAALATDTAEPRSDGLGCYGPGGWPPTRRWNGPWGSGRLGALPAEGPGLRHGRPRRRSWSELLDRVRYREGTTEISFRTARETGMPMGASVRLTSSCNISYMASSVAVAVIIEVSSIRICHTY
jgi:hypothetical protein